MYLVFQNAVLKALKLDREFVDGRPMFVSRCEDRSIVKSAPQFKVSLYVQIFVVVYSFSLFQFISSLLLRVFSSLKEKVIGYKV